MRAHRTVCTLWLLLLLHVTANARRLNLFRSNSEPREGEVRLVGSNSVSAGRVEIYHEGKWGTVCDDGWGMAEAQVVCRQLNFPAAQTVLFGSNFGEATGPIWLDDMTCNGTENYLTACELKNWGATDCSHKEDVGVICEQAGTNMTSPDFTHSLDHSISLTDDLGQLFDSGKSCDFHILVQSPTGNRWDDGTLEMTGPTICTHKVFLSRFPLFNASEGNTNITVNVSSSCQPHFTSFIRYLYTRKVDVTFSSVQCLHWMASKFGVKLLMEDIGRMFSKIIPEDALFHTQVSLYEYAEETGDLILQENCMQFLAWNFNNLTTSPAWASLSVELFEALLSRSDLVVSDEYFLLQAVETWITAKGNSTSSETQVNLLSRIRFPMIAAEKLYNLEFKSSLYRTHENMYRDNVLKALQFNVLLFSDLSSNPKFDINHDDYMPRIYTAAPWSIVIDPTEKTQTYPQYPRQRHGNPYGRRYSKSLSTPVHNSLIFKNKLISWDAMVFRSQSECPGSECESLPLAKLALRSQGEQQKNILFRNRLLLICQGKYICQVHDFKDSLAHVTVNGAYTAVYPCPDGQYTYSYVVRPEYV